MSSSVLLKGANFPPSDAPTANPPSIFSSLPRAPTHVVLQNEIPLETTRAYQTHAHEAGALTIWNPSPLPDVSTLKAWQWSELDVLIVNQGEGVELIAALSGEKRSEDEDAVKTLEELARLDVLKQNVGWIVMTRGAHGVAASVLLEGQQERTLFSLPASKPRAVRDTTGAGDTFAGYLVSALAQSSASGQTASEDVVKACLTRAKVAAAMAVETKGAMESIPTSEQVDARLREE